MAYDPILKVFKKDYETPNRSNWDWSSKNRLSMDIGYLYPVAVYDVLPNTYFKLDVNAVLSSNPTLAPILGSLKFRAEAYFVEKAAYAQKLRDNEQLNVDRDVPWPTFKYQGNVRVDSNGSARGLFSPATGLLEFLSMYPTNWKDTDWALRSTTGQEYPETFLFPKLNAIPFIMYHDIYRNFYINVQDSKNIPIRRFGFVPDGESPIVDEYVTRSDFDDFVRNARDNDDVDGLYESIFGFSPFGYYHSTMFPQDNDTLPHQRYLHHCLLRRTYGNDFFTSYISNENVELMKSKANIQVANNIINVEQISLANRNWRFATRSLLWGTDWSDYNRVHFGTKVMTRYGKPQFLGALSSTIVFNDVISQSQSDNNGSESDTVVNSLQSNKNLGSRAGLAFGALTNKTGNKKNYKPFVEFTTEEEGFVMVLMSIVPEVDYFEGVDPMYFKTNLNESYSPEFNAYGMQDFMKTWASAVPASPNSSSTIFGRSFETWNEAIHKVPIWFEYMAKYNQLHGLFTLDEQYKYWTFARVFTNLWRYFAELYDSSDAATVDFWQFYDCTYVLPEMHNYQFANTVGTDNYQVQISLEPFVKQLLDKQIIAYL